MPHLLSPYFSLTPEWCPLGGGTSNLGVGAEKGWTEKFGGLSPSAPVSNETGPVGGVVGFAIPPPDSLAPPEGRGPPPLPAQFDCFTAVGVVGFPLPPTERASGWPAANLHLLPGLQRLLDGFPFVRGLPPPQPTLPQAVQTELLENHLPLQSEGGVAPVIPIAAVTPRELAPEQVISEDEGGAAEGVGAAANLQPKRRPCPDGFGEDRAGGPRGNR